MSEFSSRLLSAGTINVSGMVTGNKGIMVPSVTTANRPSGMTGSHSGALIYDNEKETLCVWSGSSWIEVVEQLMFYLHGLNHLNHQLIYKMV